MPTVPMLLIGFRARGTRRGWVPMSLMPRLAAALMVASLFAVPRFVAADDAHPYGRTPLTQKEKLRWNVMMRDGKKLIEREQWLEASAKFSEAIRLDPHPEAFLWKGFSEEKLGHLVVAKAIHAEAWNEAKLDNLPEWVAQAEEALVEISKKVPRIVLHLPAEAGVTASIDGASIVVPAEGAEVNPGSRSVDVSAPGKQPFHADLKVEEGQVYSLDVPLPVLVPPVVAPSIPPVEGPRGCGPCSVENAVGTQFPLLLAFLAAPLLRARRRSRRRSG